MNGYYITVRFVCKDLWLKIPIVQIEKCEDKQVKSLVKEIWSAINAYSPEQIPNESEQEVNIYGLYSVSHGYWLENERKLSDYKLRFSHSPDTFARKDGDVLELQLRSHFISTSGLSHYAEGTLLKKGARSLVWKSRRFILRNYTLNFYNEKKETGFIDLSKHFSCNIVHGPISDKINIELHLVANDKVYRLTSDNLTELRHWIRILRSIYGRLHSQLHRKSTMILESPDAEKVIGNYSDASSDEENAAEHENLPPPLLEYESPSTHESILSSIRHLRLSDAVNRKKVRDYTKTIQVEGYQQNTTNPSSSSSIMQSMANIDQSRNSLYADIQGDKIGFMYKKGQRNKSLRYRLFVLRDKILYYYKLTHDPSNDDRSLNICTRYKFAGMINLEGCRIFTDKKDGKKAFIFRIVTPARVYLISTADQSEWEDWKDAFEYIGGISVEDVAGVAEDDCASQDSLQTTPSENKPYKTKLKLDYSKHGKADYSGYLMKQGNDRIGKWRKRWFVLLGRTLFYSETPTSDPLGSIPLRISNVELTSTSGEDYTFNIVVKNSDISASSLRKFKLKAMDREAFDNWIELLKIFCTS